MRWQAFDVALLVLLGIVWGVAFPFITLGLGSFSPILFVAYRFDLACALLFAWAFLFRLRPLVPPSRSEWEAVLFGALLSIVSYHALLFWGQGWTSESAAAVIVGLNPLLTTLSSHLLLEDERLAPGGALGLLLGVAGVAVLALLRPRDGPPWDMRGVGELSILFAVISWSVGSVLVRQKRPALHPVLLSAWQMLLGAGVLHVLALLLEGGGRAHFDEAGWVSLLYLSVVSSGVGLAIYYTLHRRVGPIRVNLVSNIAPAVASLSGIVILGDPLEPRVVLAYVLIASGVFLVARPTPPSLPKVSAQPG